MHALVGGMLSEAAGGTFATGALAAGANEAMVEQLHQLVRHDDNLLLAASQLVGVAAAGVTDGDLQLGADLAQNATAYNYLNHQQMQVLARALDGCEAKGSCTDVATEFFNKHVANEESLTLACNTSVGACQAKAAEIYNAVLGWQQEGYYSELDGQAADILQAFHMFNLEAGPTATAAIALPSVEAFVEALGLNPKSQAGMAAVTSVASLMAGKAASKVARGGLPGGQTAAQFEKNVDRVTRRRESCSDQKCGSKRNESQRDDER